MLYHKDHNLIKKDTEIGEVNYMCSNPGTTVQTGDRYAIQLAALTTPHQTSYPVR